MQLEDRVRTSVTRQQVVDSVMALGFERRRAGRLIAMFEEAAGLINVRTGESEHLYVDMKLHDVLEAIAPDMLLVPEPGSAHDLLNRLLLPEGWTFVHDRHKHCSLQAVRL